MNLANGTSKKDFGAIANAWSQLRDRTKIGLITTETEYDHMVRLLDVLIDTVGGDENHDLAGLLDVVGALIERYEDETFSFPSASPREILKSLMAQHELRQKDLQKELGSQGVVSEILNGRREINARQAKALANRFGVSAAVFL